MSEVNVSINGRQYGIACDEGQEQRVMDLANFVDDRLKAIKAAGAGTNDSHLLVLTSIIMADELFDARDAAANVNRAPLQGLQITTEDEGKITNAIDHMAERIEKLTSELQKA